MTPDLGPSGGRLPVATSHRLLPYERWFVSLSFRRQGAKPNAVFRRNLQNYGPEGTELVCAGIVTAFMASVLGILVPVLLVASSGRGSGALVAYCICVATCITGILPIMRATQASRAGRAFRNGRPYSKSYPT